MIGRAPQGFAARQLAGTRARVIGLALGLAFVFGLTGTAGASYETRSNISYDLGSPPADPARNLLDVYLPSVPAKGLRPIVMYAHGGGWRTGSKTNQSVPDKANLFTGLGYGFVSINYRLSPLSGDPDNPDPDRIMFPDHPDDVGEAIGWIDRNAISYGLDPDRIILIGHSAGAHLVSLVSTDPRYIKRYGVDPRQLIGTIPLDTGAFDIEQAVLGNDPDEASVLFQNAFGTIQENAVTGSWEAASPLTWADPSDPRHLFIVQAVPSRINRQVTMALKLGQTADSVVPVPLDHSGINRAVGRPGDTTPTTPAITGFIADRLAAYRKPGVRIIRRPAPVLRLGRMRSGKPKRRSVSVAFQGSGTLKGLECRLGGARFRPCTSPRRYRVSAGKFAFRVRPVYPSGRPGEQKVVKFSLKPRRARR